jgi:hypothetical protein
MERPIRWVPWRLHYLSNKHAIVRTAMVTTFIRVTRIGVRMGNTSILMYLEKPCAKDKESQQSLKHC